MTQETPPPDMSDITANEVFISELRKKYKKDAEISKILDTAFDLNAECRRLRNKIWSDDITYRFYRHLMSTGSVATFMKQQEQPAVTEAVAVIKDNKKKKKK